MYIYFSYYGTLNISFFIFIQILMLFMSVCFIETTLHDLNQIIYRWYQCDSKEIFIKNILLCACPDIFRNILKNLVVVYIATLAEVPFLDLAFSCKMMRKWYFWYCSSFFVRCIYLDPVTQCSCKFIFLHYAPSKI